MSWLRELLNRTRDPVPPPPLWFKVRHVGQPGHDAFQYRTPEGEMRILAPGDEAVIDEISFLSRSDVLRQID